MGASLDIHICVAGSGLPQAFPSHTWWFLLGPSNHLIAITGHIQISQGTFQTLHWQPGSVCRWGRAQAFPAVSLASRTPQALAPAPMLAHLAYLPLLPCLGTEPKPGLKGTGKS